MITNLEQPISRLQDGSIDYRHYLAIGRTERHRTIRTWIIRISSLSPRSEAIVTTVLLATLLPLIAG